MWQAETEFTLLFVVHRLCAGENNLFGTKLRFLIHCLVCQSCAPFVFLSKATRIIERISSAVEHVFIIWIHVSSTG